MGKQRDEMWGFLVTREAGAASRLPEEKGRQKNGGRGGKDGCRIFYIATVQILLDLA